MLPLINTAKSPATGGLVSVAAVVPGQINTTAQAQGTEDQPTALLDLNQLLQQPYPEETQQDSVTLVSAAENDIPLLDNAQLTSTDTSQLIMQEQRFLQNLPVTIAPFDYSQSQSLLQHTISSDAVITDTSTLTVTNQMASGSLFLPDGLSSADAGMSILPGQNQMTLSVQLPNDIDVLTNRLSMPVPAEAAVTSPLPLATDALQQLSDSALFSSVNKLQTDTRMPSATATAAFYQNTGSTLAPLADESIHASLPLARVNATAQQQFAALTQSPAALSAAATLLTPDSTAAVFMHSVAGGAAAVGALHQWQSEPMPSDPARFGQKLVALLSDKVDIQLGLGVNRAIIRLDPPALGSIDLSIQFEGEKLTVQLNSSNGQLKEAMQQGLELLRANLQHKLGGETLIELRMGPDNQSQQQRERHSLLADEIAANIAGVEQTESEDAVVGVTTGLVNKLV